MDSNILPYLPYALFLLFWLILMRHALLGEVTGITKKTTTPAAYTELKNQLMRDNQFYRTLWLPQIQRFAYYSDTHPAVNGNIFFHTTDLEEIVATLKGNNSDIPNPQEFISKHAIRYVILPYDSEKELFLDDRKYAPRLKSKLEQQLDTIPWLLKKTEFQPMAVYEIKKVTDLFSMHGKSIPYRKVSPTSYEIAVSDAPMLLIFATNYDSGWTAVHGNREIQSMRSPSGLNSFSLPSDGTYLIAYTPQRFMDYGLLISGVSLFLIVVYLSAVISRKRNSFNIFN